MKNKSLIVGLLIVVCHGGRWLWLLSPWDEPRHAHERRDVRCSSRCVYDGGCAKNLATSTRRPARRCCTGTTPWCRARNFDKPGKSPFMDMQLVPVYADGGSESGAVAISPRVQQNLGVRVAEVKSGSQTSTMEAVGSVAYNERDVAVVQARSNGFLERLYVRAPLDAVRKGQPLAELYVPDWVAAQEEYLSAKRIGARSEAASLAGNSPMPPRKGCASRA